MFKYRLLKSIGLASCLALGGCGMLGDSDSPKPRLTMFVGVDISGSFMQGKYYKDSINFLAHYLYGHLNG